MMIRERFRPDEISSVHIERYKFAAQYAAQKRVLDAACGTGYGTRILSQAQALSVTGVDISKEAIDAASRDFPGPNVDFVHADVMSLTGSYDLIVSIETIEHLPDPPRWAEYIPSLLAPDGMAVISTPMAINPELAKNPENKYHVREFTFEEYQQLLGAHFRRVTLFLQGFSRPKGLSWPLPKWALRRTIERLAHVQLREPYDKILTFSDWFASHGYRPLVMMALCEEPVR